MESQGRKKNSAPSQENVQGFLRGEKSKWPKRLSKPGGLLCERDTDARSWENKINTSEENKRL